VVVAAPLSTVVEAGETLPHEPPLTPKVTGAPLTATPLDVVTLMEISDVDPSAATYCGDADIETLSGG